MTGTDTNLILALSLVEAAPQITWRSLCPVPPEGWNPPTCLKHSKSPVSTHPYRNLFLTRKDRIEERQQTGETFTFLLFFYGFIIIYLCGWVGRRDRLFFPGIRCHCMVACWLSACRAVRFTKSHLCCMDPLNLLSFFFFGKRGKEGWDFRMRSRIWTGWWCEVGSLGI